MQKKGSVEEGSVEKNGKEAVAGVSRAYLYEAEGGKRGGRGTLTLDRVS